MDRVWQLETETFQDSPSFVFAPITEVVEPAEDSTALHPEIQRQAANIRTDLDRFSTLEISSLVRHGYCVGRKACRWGEFPDMFGAELPVGAVPGIQFLGHVPRPLPSQWLCPVMDRPWSQFLGHCRGADATSLGPAADLEYLA